jgi:ATP-binding cassette subfamily B protein
MVKYLKKYWYWILLSPIFMCGEVMVDLIQPNMMKTIVDEGVLGLSSGGASDLNLILSVGLKMVIIVVCGAISGVMCGVVANLAAQGFANDVRKDVFKRVMELSLEQTDKFSTGSLVTRVTNDITQVQMLVEQSIRNFVRTGMLFIGGLICMIRLNLSFGIAIGCAIPPMVLFILFFLIKANPIFTILQKKIDAINVVMQENITGARVVKAYVREDYETNRFGRANTDLRDTQLRALLLFSYMMPIINIMMNIVVVVIIYIGGIKVRAGAGVTPGSIMAAITYVTQVSHAVISLSNIFQTISRGAVSVKRLKEVLNCTPAIADGTTDGAESTGGKVEFRHVSFSYPNAGDEKVLDDINLTVSPGETLGILGATGSGKTTLVSLIPRLYDVTEGEVLIDDIDVKEYKLTALRDKVSIALQKSELFSTSIEENILWGDDDADHDKVVRASKVAQADEFINNQRDGYDTLVAEKGMSLSGGQKQRIAISRAVLKGSEILIFDDATSALDLKTEANLYGAMKDSLGNATKIIIAQRIASVKNADRIAVLDNGHIVDCADHATLMGRCDIYRDIYNSQLKGGAENE